MSFVFRVKIVAFVAILWVVLPVHLYAQTLMDSITTGTGWLISQKSDLGFWGFKGDPLKSEFTGDDLTNTYVRDTLQAILALQTIGVPEGEYIAAVDLAELSPIFSTNELAQRIAILSNAGRSTTDVQNRIMTYQNIGGAFGAFVNYPSNVPDTASTLQALTIGASTEAAAISSAVNYLLSTQDLSGGWGFIPSKQSEVYFTALAIQALSTQTQTPFISNAISHGKAFLLDHQNADGGFGSGESTVWETAESYLALSRITTELIVMLPAVDYLLGKQQADGSWNQDPYATALALQALKAGEHLDPEIDDDGDGFTENQGDCNDADASVYPGAPDPTIDGIDQDCNGIDGPPLGDVDLDFDGFTTAQGDCDDGNPNIHPGALDIPNNGIDENCDGQDASSIGKITSVNLFRVEGADRIPAATFEAYQTVAIEASLSDPSAIAVISVRNSLGEFLGVDSNLGETLFNTLNRVPGNYTAVVLALDIATNIVIDEVTIPFTLESTASVIGGLSMVPGFSHVGATETINASVLLSNRSNVPVDLSIAHTILDPSGGLLSSGSTLVSLSREQTSAKPLLVSFGHTFDQSGEYPGQVQIFIGSDLIFEASGTIAVAPNIRIDPGMTLTPDTVTPDGDKRIQIDIRLEGVETPP